MSKLTGRAKFFDRIRVVLEKAPAGFLNSQISVLEIQGRVVRELNESNIVYVGDMVPIFFGDHRDIPRFGLASLRDLHAALIEAIECHVFANSGDANDTNQSDGLAEYEFFQTSFQGTIYEVIEADAGMYVESAPESEAKVDLDSKQEMTFVQILEHGLEAIGERHARVFKDRSGMNGAPKTLDAVGQSLGLTRERIRQIQSKAMTRLRHHVNLAAVVESKLLRILSDRDSPLYLAGLPAEDSWFEGIQSTEAILDYLIDNLPLEKFGTIELHGRKVVTQGKQGEWERKIDSATAFIRDSCGMGFTEETICTAVEAIAGDGFRELSQELFKLANRYAIYSKKPEGKVLVSYGRGANQKVLAVLESSEWPLHFTEIARRVSETFGPIETRRAHSAADYVGILLGRGVYGIRSHIRISETEAEYLVGLAEELVQAGPVGRQWHAGELLSELREIEPLADKFSHFELSALLKEGSELEYMGRQIWVQVGRGNGYPLKRLDIHNAVESVLRDEGGPLAAFEIFQRVRSIRGIGAHFQIHPRGVVFRVGPSVWGLTTRDLIIPNGELNGYLDMLELTLKELHSAIHVTELSDKIGLRDFDGRLAWQVFGYAQIDARFKSFSGDFIGLCEWTETRRLSVHDALKIVLEDLLEGATAEQIQSRIEISLGRRISADTVKNVLRDRGAVYDRLRGVWFLDLDVSADEEGRAADDD